MAFEVIKLGQPIQKHWSWSGDVYRYPGASNQLGETGVEWSKHGFTHVDAPCHMIRAGWTLDDCDIGQLCGEAALVDVSDLVPSGAVNAEILEARSDHVHRGDILILRSNLHRVHPNTSPDYWQKSPYVDASGSQWIVDRGCRALVIDFPQDYCAREMDDRLVPNEEFTEHQIVLGAKLMHLEHVTDLWKIDQQRVFLIGWPLRLTGADGGPAAPLALLDWPSADPRIADISLPIAADWRGKVAVCLAKSFENGDPVQETGVRFQGHSHTHFLAPKYLGGPEDIEHFLGNRLCQRADLVELSSLPDNHPISNDDLAAALATTNNERVLLLRTGFSERVDYSDKRWLALSPYLTEAAAHWIAEKGYEVVAVDFEIDEGRKKLSFQMPAKDELSAEARLLEHGIGIIKNLTNLSALKTNNPFIAAMPLNLPGAEAAPARVLALEWSGD